MVLTLLSSLQRRVSMQGANVYSTPTIVHFTTVLLLSAVMVAPAASFGAYYAINAPIALAGLAYALSNARHMRHAGYKPQLEDWLFYAILPLAAYALLAALAEGRLSRQFSAAGLYGIGLAAILLLVTGIHNA